MKTYPQYSTKQKSIHWITALLVVFVILLPLMRDTAAAFLGGVGNVFMLHKTLGVVVFFLTVWRIAVVIKEGVPEVLPKHEKFQRISSKAVQGLIYLLLLMMPLSGYLMGNRPFLFAGIVSIPAAGLPDGIRGFFHTAHVAAAYTLIALLVVHVLAALYHHYYVKDNVLRSMLPARKPR